MNKITIIIVIIAIGINGFLITPFAQAKASLELSYYLPNFEQYDATVPTPQSILGYQVGEWHARPEQVEFYFRELAKSNPRVKIHTYAHSHEKRPLFLVYISSEENIRSLEEIRQKHLKMEKQVDRPAVTWMGYSVHGNEASGSNASLLFAYHLAAANDKQTIEQLEKQIIIIDPMLNPDGLARFAHWANMYKSKKPNRDPNTREHNEAWPKGRTNHYWFDLNRDWLLLQHPESQGRIKMFHQWMPNVLTDFHEMGTNNTYFFQPGVKTRQNPLTPKENFELTAKIAEYHADSLDEIGSLYFSKESFDDFYYGKGSTYPDINGSIGILFEQASARGHIQKSINGDVSFPFAIKNHLTTSFSTIKAVQENRSSLLQYQRNFYQKARLNANSSRTRAIVYASNDEYRLKEFNKILTGHKIQFSPLARELEINGKTYSPQTSFIVPMRQKQFSLITSIFEKREQFDDNTFYDVSSWTMPLAFDIDFQMVNRSNFDPALLSKELPVTKKVFESIDERTIAIAFNWDNFASSNLLNYLHQNDIKVRVASKPVKVATDNGHQILKRGDIFVPVKSQKYSVSKLTKLLQFKITELNLNHIAIRSGLSITGPDLGSPSMPMLKPVNPLMIIGDDVNSYQAGEVWHLLDQRLDQDLTMMTIHQFSKLKNIKYTHLILVDGKYEITKNIKSKIDVWIKNGGILMTQSRASEWIAKQGWLSSKGSRLQQAPNTNLEYSSMSDSHSKHLIGGAISATTVDLSHPLGFGLSDNQLAIFKRGQFSFSEPKESFVSFARFNQKTLLAGYMSKANQDNLSGKTSILVQGHGTGKIIAFTEDMNFRGFWLGTSRVFVNALYFGDIIRAAKKTKKKVVKKLQNKLDFD